MNRYATLIREKPNQTDATIGLITTDTGKPFSSCELPWLNNQPGISCIPPGKYQCLWQWSSDHQCNNYRLQNVPLRIAIELHPANVPEQLLGCIALGMSIGTFAPNSISEGMPKKEQRGIIESQTAIAQFEAEYRDANTGEQLPFYLMIQ